MKQRSVVLTAGYDKAFNIAGLAELLRRDGATVAGILVCTPFSWSRAKSLASQRGFGFFRDAAQRLLSGRSAGNASGADPVEEYLQTLGVKLQSLSQWAATHAAPFQSVQNLNSDSAIAFLQSCNPDYVLYGGGGILKKRFIEAAHGNVLNAHSGPLPSVRGMNACEWSILLGCSPTVTIHFIDHGIDTGPVISALPVAVLPADDMQKLRRRCLQLGIVGLQQAVSESAAKTTAGESEPAFRQCFVMAPAMRQLAERKLRQLQSRLT